MNYPATKLVLFGIGFLLTLGTGLWLSHLGKPYNGAVFTIHKLIALATVIVIGMSIRQMFAAAELPTVLASAATTAAGLLFLALFVSGALLSVGNIAPVLVLRVHQAAPLLALAASGAALILLIQAAGNASTAAPF